MGGLGRKKLPRAHLSKEARERHRGSYLGINDKRNKGEKLKRPDGLKLMGPFWGRESGACRAIFHHWESLFPSIVVISNYS